MVFISYRLDFRSNISINFRITIGFSHKKHNLDAVSRELRQKWPFSTLKMTGGRAMEHIHLSDRGYLDIFLKRHCGPSVLL